MNIHSCLKFKFHFTNEQPSVLLRGRDLAVAKLIWIWNFYFCVINSLISVKFLAECKGGLLLAVSIVWQSKTVMGDMIFLELVIFTQEVRVEQAAMVSWFKLLEFLQYSTCAWFFGLTESFQLPYYQSCRIRSFDKFCLWDPTRVAFP